MSNPVYKKCPNCNGIRHKKKGLNKYKCNRCGCIYDGVTREILSKIDETIGKSCV